MTSLMVWRLATFSIGLALLLWGVDHYQLPDWDYGVSILMALGTAGVMHWFDKAMQEGRLLDAFGLMCLPVVVIYDLYCDWYGMPALPVANFMCSSMMFQLCWVIWYPTTTVSILRRYL